MSKPSRRKTRQARKSKSGHPLNRKERAALKAKRQQNLILLREEKNTTNSKIIPHTQAKNCKSSLENTADEQAEYENIAEAQLDTWRQLLPSIIRDFSKIPDPRNPKQVKHKIAVAMMFGLFIFLFRLNSRRDMNDKLTSPSINETLRKFFPEIDSIPHSDTISRLLARIDIQAIERLHIKMMRKLIKNKKFKKLLIQGFLPVSFDGTQKAVRNGQLQEEGWLLRTIKTAEGEKFQQYVYVLEANITFANGLSVPLLTEHCYLEVDFATDSKAKQDCELNGFKRLANRLKKYFPRLKIMAILDNLYACDSVLDTLDKKKWEYMIKLPAKLKSLYDPLKAQEKNSVNGPGNSYYRERKQQFYWLNHVMYKGHEVHVVGCFEEWKIVCSETGDIKKMCSRHTWISSLPLSINNVHVLCNLAARKRALIEDSMNTEKNRGYQYQHIFSYNWNALRGFHYLMRLAHAINALSEFTKKFKKFVRDLGISNALTRVYEALKHRWLSEEWFEKQLQKNLQLCFQFE